MKTSLNSFLLLTVTCLTLTAQAQVPFERILNAADEPHNWLTYNGGYMSQRFSLLDQINADNVSDLELKWVLQNQVFGAWQSNPLIVDGVMYLTERPNSVMAVDAISGRVFWKYRHVNDERALVCCGANNRGVAILGDTVFMGTLDAHLIALDRVNGELLWKQEVGDVARAYSVTMAPLVVKDKVIVGVGGGEFGIRGYVAAYEADTGELAWKTYTIPGPGESGHDSWEGDDWEHGGAPVWITGSYDPELNQTYWGVGNPGPDWNAGQRPGDNLYSDSVLALDADTGELEWYFQFTPNDAYDYDSVQVPLLADIEWQGEARKVMLWANRNGYFYVLDRTDGEFLLGEPYVRVNWSSGLDEDGRPIPTPQPEGMPTFPGNQGGTNWYPPSFSPRTGLFYFSAWEDYATIYRAEESEYVPGRAFLGGGFSVLGARAGCADDWHWAYQSHQQLDQRSGFWLGESHGPADWRSSLGIQPVRRQ
ncbi:MAG: PQQ-binding-like beta-propeller repeat protein [Pseudohongiellaceae bacterium]